MSHLQRLAVNLQTVVIEPCEGVLPAFGLRKQRGLVELERLVGQRSPALGPFLHPCPQKPVCVPSIDRTEDWAAHTLGSTVRCRRKRALAKIAYGKKEHCVADARKSVGRMWWKHNTNPGVAAENYS